MAQFLIPSGSRRISQLTQISEIPLGSSSAMPIVLGDGSPVTNGSTFQISHTDFLNSTVFNQPNVFTQAQTVSRNGAKTELAGNYIDMYVETGNGDTFKVEVITGEGLKMQDWNGANSQSFLEVDTNSGPITILRNTSIDGNLIVSGGITTEILNVNVISSSIVYSSGSNIFGNTISSTHQFTGSLRVSGSANIIGGFTQTVGAVSFGGVTTFGGAATFTPLATFSNGVNIFQAASFFGPVNIGTSPQPRTLTHFGNYIHTGDVIQTGSISVNGNQNINGDVIVTGSLIVSGSNTFRNIGRAEFTGSFNVNGGINVTQSITASIMSGSFVGDGTLLSGVSAADVEFANILNKPTLVSGSSQIDLTQTTNYISGIKDRLNAETVVSSSQQVITLLPEGTVSGSSQIQYSSISNIPNGIVSSSTQINQYNIFATTGSNEFVGNQSVNGDVIVTGSLIVSGSNTFRNIGRAEFTGSVSVDGGIMVTQSITASVISGSFVGDGSSLSGVTAADVDFVNVLNKPTLVSGSSQIDLTGTTNYVSGIKTRLNAETVVSSSQQIKTLLPTGTVSGSSQVSFNGIVDKPTLVSGSSQITYSGISSIPTGIVSSSTQVLNYGIFATTGSNEFVGNQIITGSVDISGSLDINNDVKIENGYVILTQVSQSLEFEDDVAAELGNVPLGGLYRSGSFIKIRIS